MIYNERQNNILKILKQQKNIKVSEIAAALYVSEATVRRDLADMQKLGVIKRNHGGAILVDVADEISLFVRMNVNARQKEAVAAKAIAHIPEFKSVFIDSSSTALALAQRLELAHKTVVTNNLQTAILLSRIENINLMILGGNISLASVSITGSWTANQLRTFSFDLMLSSCAAVKGTDAYEKSIDQRELKRIAFENSAVRILLIDSAKLDKKDGTYLYGSLDSFDKVIFDKLDETQRKRFNGPKFVV